MTPYLVDVNVWIALAHDGHEHHTKAVVWFETVGYEEALFCRATQLGFLRLLTNRRIAESCGARPCSLTQAWAAYDALQRDPRVGILAEPPDMEDEFRRLSEGPFASTNLLADAYLGAFANTWGIALATFDGGFSARRGVRDLVIIE